jgi:hypothetical protein
MGPESEMRQLTHAEKRTNQAVNELRMPSNTGGREVPPVSASASTAADEPRRRRMRRHVKAPAYGRCGTARGCVCAACAAGWVGHALAVWRWKRTMRTEQRRSGDRERRERRARRARGRREVRWTVEAMAEARREVVEVSIAIASARMKRRPRTASIGKRRDVTSIK